jgi:hypothetical protein
MHNTELQNEFSILEGDFGSALRKSEIGEPSWM